VSRLSPGTGTPVREDLRAIRQAVRDRLWRAQAMRRIPRGREAPRKYRRGYVFYEAFVRRTRDGQGIEAEVRVSEFEWMIEPPATVIGWLTGPGMELRREIDRAIDRPGLGIGGITTLIAEEL